MAAVLAAIVFTLTMPRPAGAQDAGEDEAKVAKGQTTYAERCSHCHGFNMINSGAVVPDLRRFPDDKDRFFNTVKQGKNNRMPPWSDILNDDDIGAVWAYVSSQRKP
ncbi:MAG: cytochrome c [Bradyrhizobium sp.]|nr:cytochrome c [Bradyrhizobium sp.]